MELLLVLEGVRVDIWGECGHWGEGGSPPCLGGGEGGTLCLKG